MLGKIFCLGNDESFDLVENEAGMGTGIGNILLFSGCRKFCPLVNDVPAEFKADGNAENKKKTYLSFLVTFVLTLYIVHFETNI